MPGTPVLGDGWKEDQFKAIGDTKVFKATAWATRNLVSNNQTTSPELTLKSGPE